MSTYPYPLHSTRLPATRLWFGLLGASVAWILQGFLEVVISWQGCREGGVSLNMHGDFPVQWVVAGVTVVLFAVSVAAGYVSYRNWRTLSSKRLVEAQGRGREEYMGLCGIFVSVIFAGSIFWSGLPLFLTDLCGRIR